jgi:hypothetical protein
MKAGNLPGQFLQLPPVQTILKMPASRDQIDLPVRNIVVEYMMTHAPEWRNARPRTNKEKILLDSIRQSKDALRPPQRQFTPNPHLIKKISRTRTAFQEHDHQFYYIGSVRPGCNAIASDPLIELLMDRKVQRHELTRLKVKRLHPG